MQAQQVRDFYAIVEVFPIDGITAGFNCPRISLFMGSCMEPG